MFFFFNLYLFFNFSLLIFTFFLLNLNYIKCDTILYKLLQMVRDCLEVLLLILSEFKEFEKWSVIRASVGGMLRGWRE